MSLVHVVPIRRLPANRAVLSYRWELPTPPVIGQFVRIPLMRSTVLGCVCSVGGDADIDNLRSVTALVTERPIVSEWQRRGIDVMAETGSCSVADILFSVVPKLSAKTWSKYTVSTLKTESKLTDETTTLWYRDRDQALETLRDWSKQHENNQRLILVPTIDDIQELEQVFAQSSQHVYRVDGTMSPTSELQIWQAVAAGEPMTVIGTQHALTLPWPSSPSILIDQIEHHAHKQTTQHPRLDTRILLEHLDLPYSWTSPAPTVRMMHRQALEPNGVPHTRKLANLTRETGWSWLTDESVTAIDEAHAKHQRVLIIAPRRGYATSMFCRQCQHVVACPSCQHPASIIRGTHQQAICSFCHQSLPLSFTCPTCRGHEWGWRGTGVDRIVEVAQQQWPQASIAPTLDPRVPADIAVDTYAAYRQLRSVQSLGCIIVVNGDALRNIADYSTEERAWQYLARLSASTSSPVIIQTFQPEQKFWQRWLHGDDRAWYNDELATRQQQHLPPYTNEWLVRVPQPVADIEERWQQFMTKYPTVEKSALPPSQRHRRWILRWPGQPDIQAVQNFPTPWQVDQYPSSWLD